MTRYTWIALFPLMLLAALAPGAAAQNLHLVQTIPLPDVEGRIDHLAVDVPGRRLFVAALGNNTLEVLDLTAGRRTHRISNLHEPQGVAFVPGHARICVANGQGGSLDVYDGRIYASPGRVALGDDADNVRYDANAGRLYVGYGDGALAVVDPGAGKLLARVPLQGHPESFQLERDGARIYVNVPSAGHIAVVDRRTSRVVATWPVTAARANFPMALDEGHHRLFLGCREPARLLVYDTATGHMVTSVAIDGDTDDVFYDAARRTIYISCGAGYLDVVAQKDPNKYATAARLPTAAGARTSLYVPELDRLYLAVPHRGGQSAEVRVFSTRP